MNNEVLKYTRHEMAQKRTRNEVSYEEYYDTRNDLKSLYDAENGQIERVRELDRQQMLVEIGLEALDDREKHIISHLFKLTDNNMGREELATYWGISPTHITNIKNKALTKMKRSLEE
jgi:DNA-directed RNA polymerase specialized sigma subunit